MHCRGIYVPDKEAWPAAFRGIGIRIEDSVCVGDEHPIVLTTEAVKEVRWSIFLYLDRGDNC
jgi:intermediate cleaving peptidase 55